MENMDYSHKGSDDMSDRITINFFYYLSNYLCIIVGSLVCLWYEEIYMFLFLSLFIPKLLYTFLIAIILMMYFFSAISISSIIWWLASSWMWWSHISRLKH